MEVASGLHHVHELSTEDGPLRAIHRDVSPANIMVGFDGSVKVLDFGIAKAEERATKTLGGAIKGKYGYMSPEQCKGQPIDRRSDIFALGIVLYELTTLRRAFKGNDDFETMKRIVEGDVMLPSAAVPGYPPELESIVLTAMANDQNARFQTAQDLIEALDAFAVRDKLTGTNTAMGRYMVQLFGTKKEPWVGGGNETTDINEGGPGHIDEHDEHDTDLEKTIVAGPRASASRIATALGTDAPPVPARADAAAWANDAAYAAQRGQRGSSQRPVAAPDAVGSAGGKTPAPQRLTPTSMAQAGGKTPAPQRLTPASMAQAGGKTPAPQRPTPAAMHVPLVDDPKPGWKSSPEHRRRPREEPIDTRLADEPADPRVTSSTWWLALALVIVLGVAAAVVVIATRT
jgi:serine/threonine-protein kinase